MNFGMEMMWLRSVRVSVVFVNIVFPYIRHALKLLGAYLDEMIDTYETPKSCSR